MSINMPKDTIKDHINGGGLHCLSQLVLKTCNFQIQQLDRLSEVIAGDRPVIYTGWHGITMMAVPLDRKISWRSAGFCRTDAR